MPLEFIIPGNLTHLIGLYFSLKFKLVTVQLELAFPLLTCKPATCITQMQFLVKK